METLVVIAILAAVMAIVLPALRGARTAAEDLESQVHQREVGSALLLAYANDHQNRFPYFGVEGTRRTVPYEFTFGPLAGDTTQQDYWSQPRWWNMWLATQGYDGFMAIDAPEVEQPELAIGAALDLMTYCAFAADRYFTEAGANDVSLHHGRRWDEVRSASLKGILIRTAPSSSAGGVPVSADPSQIVWFADAHSEILSPSALNPGVSLANLIGDPPVATTRHGLAGRDK